MKHANIAIFVPHNGCPHQCTFCNQREITGQAYQPDENDVIHAAEIAKKSLGEKAKNAEIAFFGGSFTAIDRDYMLRLLKTAFLYIQNHDFYGIRISTRPDAVNQEILAVLKKYGVTSIELGAQSMNNKVLSLNKRGHTAEDIIHASELIKANGFSLGLQMMTGLYGSSDEIDRQTAEHLAGLSPETMRIYPTVVMKGTELYELYQKRDYQPQTLEEAVKLCSVLLKFFEEKKISVIRLGLHDSDSLRKNMAAGAFHPAFRELCESEIIFENTLSELQKMNRNQELIFEIHPQSISRFTGQKKVNLKKLENRGIKFKIAENHNLGKYEVKIKFAGDHD